MKILRALIIMMAIVSGGNCYSQERPLHEVYSMMIFNFVKFVQWPEGNTNEFVIGVVGSNDIYKTLTTWYNGKTRGTKTILIKKFDNAAELSDCQVVFIDRSKSNEFKAVNQKVKGKATLVVTDKDGLGAKGSCINFTVVDEKLRIELNQRAIEESNLKVSTSLSNMAILI